MGAIKHAMMLGDSIIELLAGEPPEFQKMALEYAVSITLSVQDRQQLGESIHSYATYGEVDALEEAEFAPLPERVTDAIDDAWG